MALVAGCSNFSSPPSNGEGSNGTNTTSASHSTSKSPENFTLSLRPSTGLAVDNSVLVYPKNLQRWIREAARSNITQRVRATTYMERPNPPFPTLGTIQLTDHDSQLNGTFRVTGEGGTWYERHADAEVVEPPESESVTPVEELSQSRADFVKTAIEQTATFYPETTLGEWIRLQFIDGYFRHEGTFYRGKRYRFTDHRNFNKKAWYIFSVDGSEAKPAPTIRLGEINTELRELIDGMLVDKAKGLSGIRSDQPPHINQFFEETSYLLTHSEIYYMDSLPIY